MLEGRQLGSWRVGCFYTFLAATLKRDLEGRLPRCWKVGSLDPGGPAAFIHFSPQNQKNDLEGRLPGCGKVGSLDPGVGCFLFLAAKLKN